MGKDASNDTSKSSNFSWCSLVVVPSQLMFICNGKLFSHKQGVGWPGLDIPAIITWKIPTLCHLLSVSSDGPRLRTLEVAAIKD